MTDYTAKDIRFEPDNIRPISDKELKRLVEMFKEGIHYEATFTLTEEQSDSLRQMLMTEEQYFLFALNHNLPEARLKK